MIEVGGAPYGTRTRVTAVKGRCPRPLDEGRAGGPWVGAATYRGVCRRRQGSAAATNSAIATRGRPTAIRRVATSPLAGVGHRGPRLLRRQRGALLQELDRM